MGTSPPTGRHNKKGKAINLNQFHIPLNIGAATETWVTREPQITQHKDPHPAPTTTLHQDDTTIEITRTDTAAPHPIIKASAEHRDTP